ncbi:MAG TPA: bile acid:sodium symporter [Bacteroidales bacterium]|nr:bile acid:sodium symporter [Bacteroidales bacterium]
MRIGSFVEKYFWLFLVAGIVLGLWNPVNVVMGRFLPKILLGLMLFFVFLKIDAIEILENIRNYKLMIYITLVYMFIIPLVFYSLLNFFNPEIATGILLLTAMPAGVSTPALADIVKGNISLSMSLVIISQLIAPFTVPVLFWLINLGGLEINKILIFRDIAILVFLPMILSQVVKRFFPVIVRKTQHLLTSANVLLLFAFVYVALSSQRDLILENPLTLIWKIVILYAVFILLHLLGYIAYFKGSRENRISVAIGAAYMNNGMAIVLAASYFSPEILVFMVLSELPWNTLLEPFRRVMAAIK